MKHSIESAIKDAGLNINAKKAHRQLNDVNELVGNKKEVTAEDIRRVVIGDFEQDWEGNRVPVAKTWRNYELKHEIIYRE